jgi:hypothetical protein
MSKQIFTRSQAKHQGPFLPPTHVEDSDPAVLAREAQRNNERRQQYQRDVQAREAQAQREAVERAEQERIEKAVRNYFLEGVGYPEPVKDTNENRAFNQRVRDAIHKEDVKPNSLLKQQRAAMQPAIDEENRRRIWNSLPDSWSDVTRQYYMNEWKARNKLSRQEWFNALWSDTEGTDFYAINSILQIIPPRPDGKNRAEEDNYYNELLPWGAVQNAWAHDLTVDTTNWSQTNRTKRERWTVRDPRFTARILAAKGGAALPDPVTFSYTAVFLGAAFALLAIIIKT